MGAQTTTTKVPAAMQTAISGDFRMMLGIEACTCWGT